FRLEWK
ncbi:hypothetical protein BVRB_037860, partial [Beta vulgaris subsp. vulgaris]